MNIFEAAIGWLAPPQCISCGAEGSALCPDCAALDIKPFGERCWRCNAISPGRRTCASCRHTGSPAHVWITTDHSGLARGLISLYKFGHQRAAAKPIAAMMIKTFLDSGSPQKLKDYLVVPIPTATGRMRQRSFGHSELLAKNIADDLQLEYAHALRRLGQSRQLGAKRETRLIQLQNSFALKNSRYIYSRNILLIDDVVTTGGTMIAATKALKAGGAKQVDALLFTKRL